MKTKKRIFTTFVFILSIIILGCTNRPIDDRTGSVLLISDSTLELFIVKEFQSHPYISADSILVTAQEGIITLGGKTDNLLEKEKAEELVSMIRGVKGIVNLIEVVPEPIADSALRNKIYNVLEQDPVIESYEIIVNVDSGIAELSGIVDSWHEKEFVEDVIKTVSGIRKVNNNIAFVYQSDRAGMDIKTDVISALNNDVRIANKLIDVTVKDNIVELSGTVGSLAEKSLAIVSSYVPGVDTVIADDVVISPEQRNPLMRKDKYIHKSDEEIIAAISRTFVADPRLLYHDIEIESNDGHVILSGAVNNLRAKKAAEEDARNVVGVWTVENKISVKPIIITPKKTVADKVKTALEYHPSLKKFKIMVEDSSKGIITLKGKVDYNYDRLQSEQIASRQKGVTEVINDLVIVQGVPLPYYVSPGFGNYPEINAIQIKSDEDIKEGVENQLWWSPFVDRNQIYIEVKDGIVTLSGTVNTALEMEFAVKNAYEGGAVRVINKLDVDFWEI